MNQYNEDVRKIKAELLRRVEHGKQKSISSQKLQQFLIDWFKYPKRSSLSDYDQKNLQEIQTLFDQNDIAVYSKNHGVDYLTLQCIKLFDPISIRPKYIKSEHAGVIEVQNGISKKSPYRPFQVDAIEELTKTITAKPNYSGILSIPTGGGKTYTSVYWLLKNIIDNNGKILWIAHRHELLDQAFNTFANNAYMKDCNGERILKQKKEIRYRIISGTHGDIRNICPSDELIIACKDSISHGVIFKNGKISAPNSSGLRSMFNNWLKEDQKQEVFMVIDEAHHATNKTYRYIIDFLKEKGVAIKLLGLTATPFQYDVAEQGLLRKVFKDGITYSVGINKLIEIGFLARPNIREEVNTGFDMTSILSQKELERIKSNDLDCINKKSAKTLGENVERNHFIVDHYLKNKELYGQTIVFAINVSNAIALKKMFNENNIKTEYVISRHLKHDSAINSKVQENKEKIESFRNGEVQVIISYNILTEGIDVPKVQTVFLGRPTLSRILMTQMIGRGLRGQTAGGTETVNIIPFVDNWHNLISWVSPKQLDESDYDFTNKPSTIKQFVFKAISQHLQNECITLNRQISTELKKEIEARSFVDRLPVGLYLISVEKGITIETNDRIKINRDTNVMVYSHLFAAYSRFIQELPALFELSELDQEDLTEEQVEELANHVHSSYFTGLNLQIGFYIEDVKDIIRYYAAVDEPPEFLNFDERAKFNIEKLAKKIYNSTRGINKLQSAIEVAWLDKETGWQVLFGYNFHHFKTELNLGVDKLMYPESYKPSIQKPIITCEIRRYEDTPLGEIRKHNPEYYKYLRDNTFKQNTNRNKEYFSTNPKFASDKKIFFDISYKIPLSDGGHTILSNLQLQRKIMTWTLKMSENI